ncbi:MAG TPA: hypothetical protein VFQ53_15945 [Kofleriaceae bacterium]|nr:hypothetical protein [Kofleriaceae bacterium]
MKSISTVFAFALVAGACGGSDLDPGSGNDPGTGTNTLLVDGRARAEANVVNARIPADYTTEVSVRVTLNGVTVTTGTVTITSATDSVPLVFNPDEGRWGANLAGYDEVYVLDVESGPDSVTGVRVDGPDIHSFTLPELGAVVDSTQPLEVHWTRHDEADFASIDTARLDGDIQIADNGIYTLPANSLEADSSQPKDNTIELRRTNRVIPAGAVAGSEWNVGIVNDLQVVAQANPAL